MRLSVRCDPLRVFVYLFAHLSDCFRFFFSVYVLWNTEQLGGGVFIDGGLENFLKISSQGKLD